MNNKQKSPREKLLKDMKRTKGVRFNASKRVENAELKATRNTAYASVAVIVITLLPVFFSMNNFFESSIALLTIALSIFILASSLLRSSNSGLVKAEQFQRCALEVNSLRRELDSSATNAKLSDFAMRYDEILKRYNINHDQSDYDQYRLEHPDEFPDFSKEEINVARSNLKHVNRSSNAIGSVITAVAMGLTAATIVSAPEFIGGLSSLFDRFKNIFE